MVRSLSRMSEHRASSKIWRSKCSDAFSRPCLREEVGNNDFSALDLKIFSEDTKADRLAARPSKHHIPCLLS